MKLLLLGGNGQVGHELRRSLAPLGDVVVTTRDGRLGDGKPAEPLDLSDLEAIPALVQRVRPDAVVNATAYTAVDRAEGERELAFRINAEAPAVLASSCAEAGIPLLHYSTDYVFDGQGKRPYREDDPTSPLGVYGESKLAGEQAIRGSGAGYLILRTAWVYALHGHNFLRTMLRLGAERDELRVVSDQVGSPTPAWLIADATAEILLRGIGTSGILHLTSAGECSWHAFASEIMRLGVATGRMAQAPRVTPIATAEYPTPARRPAYSVLDTRHLVDRYGVDLPRWEDALARTLSEDGSD
ncbi:dTDP-4-dehydrorhamnose reductase [Marilutibacter chinensis]|uniref:dTDP-4-dehydrorhamnose reductase n=1 Tax=Marilutibacter chinensis TaxID=2912247 RepID=A0ABS9HW35_9GAMM|nr:dTDP-4-dehydrorhamnose reductase [Lysobacter chinensis]MCF7222394.1 dTDP-4-dehydrorhamnose reductase [Lysobacter chinensis]